MNWKIHKLQLYIAASQWCWCGLLGRIHPTLKATVSFACKWKTFPLKENETFCYIRSAVYATECWMCPQGRNPEHEDSQTQIYLDFFPFHAYPRTSIFLLSIICLSSTLILFRRGLFVTMSVRMHVCMSTKTFETTLSVLRGGWVELANGYLWTWTKKQLGTSDFDFILLAPWFAKSIYQFRFC